MSTKIAAAFPKRSARQGANWAATPISMLALGNTNNVLQDRHQFAVMQIGCGRMKLA
jgi:hypothetical protein